MIFISSSQFIADVVVHIMRFKWIYRSFLNFILFQELNLAEAVVNRLQTVALRFCGAADQALPRLRGALPAGTDFIADCLSNMCQIFYLSLAPVQLQISLFGKHLMSCQTSFSI